MVRVASKQLGCNGIKQSSCEVVAYTLIYQHKIIGISTTETSKLDNPLQFREHVKTNYLLPLRWNEVDIDKQKEQRAH